jgi:nicotinamide-nucleotide amidase
MTAAVAIERELAARLVTMARARQWTITTAESCTGGLVAGAITAIPGASDVLECGFVTYSNAAKTRLLDVPAGLIGAVGAVSEAVARRMAAGARLRGNADLAVSVTGIAGPGGGSAAKPVGTVWFGLAGGRGELRTCQKLFTGNRDHIRAASVIFALELLLEGMSE